MFDFQKLKVYQKAKDYNHEIKKILADSNIDRITHDQLKRASLSIMLNIAEGSSRFSNRDRRKFMVISRGSAFECVSIFEYLLDDMKITGEVYDYFYNLLEGISKMLFAIIRKLET